MKTARGFGLITLLVILMALVAGAIWYQYDKKHQAELKQEAFKKQLNEMMALAEKWDDANQLASSTPRLSLSGPVSNLQSIKRETQAYNFTGCLVTSQGTLVDVMNKTIEAYIDFMSDKEYLAQSKLTEVKEKQEAFKSQITDCGKSLDI